MASLDDGLVDDGIIFEDSLWELDDIDDEVVMDINSDEDDTESHISGVETDTRTAAIGHIEDLILSFLTQLSSALPSPASTDREQETTCVMKAIKPKKIELQLADRKKLGRDGLCGVRSITYPKKSQGASAKPVAQLFRVLDLAHESLVNGVPVTKRDLYYNDVPLFKSQSVVDRLVDDLAATFNLERSDFNIRATSKGLVCGSGLVIHLLSGETVHVNDFEGALIPVGEDISRFEVDEEISWVLIVEKDAVFQTLCRLKLANHPALCRGIIITGKGYPDIATRQLVKTLSDNLPLTIPILALVDGDAYGLDILSVYKHGSFAMRHENEKLAAGRIEWIGVWASELAGLGVDRDAMIPMMRHDEKKALSMLRRSEFVMPTKWRKELMHMLHTRRKAEIEIISSATPVSTGFPKSRPHNQQVTRVHTPDRDENFAAHSGSDMLRTLLDDRPSSPLFRYLFDKISGFVGSHA